MNRLNVGVSAILLVISISITACQLPQEQPEPRSNGFVNVDNPEVQGKQWKMGSQAAVDLISQLVDDYNAKNVDAVMSAVADTAVFIFADGSRVAGKDSLRKGLTEFINNMESFTWSTVFAYSVDIDLDSGGEWVFLGGDEARTPKGGEQEVVGLLEAMYVMDGKIVEMHQFSREAPLLPQSDDSGDQSD